jgi:hypothetical protein
MMMSGMAAEVLTCLRQPDLRKRGLVLATAYLGLVPIDAEPSLCSRLSLPEAARETAPAAGDPRRGPACRFKALKPAEVTELPEFFIRDDEVPQLADLQPFRCAALLNSKYACARVQ